MTTFCSTCFISTYSFPAINFTGVQASVTPLTELLRPHPLNILIIWLNDSYFLHPVPELKHLVVPAFCLALFSLHHCFHIWTSFHFSLCHRHRLYHQLFCHCSFLYLLLSFQLHFHPIFFCMYSTSRQNTSHCIFCVLFGTDLITPNGMRIDYRHFIGILVLLNDIFICQVCLELRQLLFLTFAAYISTSICFKIMQYSHALHMQLYSISARLYVAFFQEDEGKYVNKKSYTITNH